jgi:hypothetical protein
MMRWSTAWDAAAAGSAVVPPPTVWRRGNPAARPPHGEAPSSAPSPPQSRRVSRLAVLPTALMSNLIVRAWIHLYSQVPDKRTPDKRRDSLTTACLVTVHRAPVSEESRSGKRRAFWATDHVRVSGTWLHFEISDCFYSLAGNRSGTGRPILTFLQGLQRSRNSATVLNKIKNVIKVKE